MEARESPRRMVYSNSLPTIRAGSEAKAPGAAAAAAKQSAENTFQSRFTGPPGLFDERARRLSETQGDANSVPCREHSGLKLSPHPIPLPGGEGGVSPDD